MTALQPATVMMALLWGRSASSVEVTPDGISRIVGAAIWAFRAPLSGFCRSTTCEAWRFFGTAVRDSVLSFSTVKGEIRHWTRRGLKGRVENLLALLLDHQPPLRNQSKHNPAGPRQTPYVAPLRPSQGDLKPVGNSDDAFCCDVPNSLTQSKHVEHEDDRAACASSADSSMSDLKESVAILTRQQKDDLLGYAALSAGLLGLLNPEFWEKIRAEVRAQLSRERFRTAAQLTLGYVHYTTRLRNVGIAAVKKVPDNFQSIEDVKSNRESALLGQSVSSRDLANPETTGRAYDFSLAAHECLESLKERVMSLYRQILDFVSSRLQRCDDLETARKRAKTSRISGWASSNLGEHQRLGRSLISNDFGAVECVYYLRICAGLGFVGELSVQRRVCRELKWHLRSPTPSNLLSSPLHELELVDVIRDRPVDRTELSMQDLLAVINSLARLRFPEPELVHLVVNLLRPVVHRLSCLQISSLCQSFSILDYNNPEFVQLLSKTFLHPQKMERADFRVIGNMLHAFHLMGFRDDELLQACAVKALVLTREDRSCGSPHSPFLILNAVAGSRVLNIPLAISLIPIFARRVPHVSPSCAVQSWCDLVRMSIWSGSYREEVVKKIRRHKATLSLKSVCAAASLCFHYLSFFDAPLLTELLVHVQSKFPETLQARDQLSVATCTILWRALYCIQWLAMTPRDVKWWNGHGNAEEKFQSPVVNGENSAVGSDIQPVTISSNIPSPALDLKCCKSFKVNRAFHSNETSLERDSDASAFLETGLCLDDLANSATRSLRNGLPNGRQMPFSLQSYLSAPSPKKNRKAEANLQFSPWRTVSLYGLSRIKLESFPSLSWQRASSSFHEEVHAALPIELQKDAQFERRMGPYVVDEVISSCRFLAWKSAAMKRRGRRPRLQDLTQNVFAE